MKIFLDALGNPPSKPWHDPLLKFQKLVADDEVGKHTVIQDQDSADIILTFFYDHPIYCKLPVDKRRFGFSTYDLGFPVYPGLYSSLPSWNANPCFARSSPYPLKIEDEGEDFPNFKDRSYLFSFTGSVLTSPIRHQVLKLKHQKSFLRDTSQNNAYKGGQSYETYKKFRTSFQQILADSYFVLCPRGVGVSSIRLFETMRAARVPVVISDHWVPPLGIPWEQFIVRVDENDIESIPDRLESLKNQAVEMGNEARIQWEKHFSNSQLFNWTIDQIAEMNDPVKSGFQKWKMTRLISLRNLREATLPMLIRKMRTDSTF